MPPLPLIRRFDIHFAVLEVPTIPDAGHDGFGVEAEGALGVGEEGEAEGVLEEAEGGVHFVW